MLKYAIIIIILLIPTGANNKLEEVSKKVSETTSLYELIYEQKEIRADEVPSKEVLTDYLSKVVAVYGLDYGVFYDLIQCESSWVVLADNPNSSAFGLTQWTDATWSETESYNRGLTRSNPYAILVETAEDLKNGESWRWQECVDKYNLEF